MKLEQLFEAFSNHLIGASDHKLVLVSHLQV